MCIECRRQSIKHLAAMLDAGKTVPVEPSPELSPAGVVRERDAHVLIGGQVAEMLRLSMPTHEDGDTISRALGAEGVQKMSGFLSVLPDEQVWLLALSLGYFREALGVAEDIAIGALKASAEAGSFKAMQYLGHAQVMTMGPVTAVMLDLEGLFHKDTAGPPPRQKKTGEPLSGDDAKRN